MQIIEFNAANVKAFKAQLEKAKAALLEKCKREMTDGVINSDVSVVRYNMARQELKQDFSVEVIGMLDASGFINEVLCKEEQAWLRVRKVRSLSYNELAKFQAWEAKKGGNS